MEETTFEAVPDDEAFVWDDVPPPTPPAPVPTLAYNAAGRPGVPPGPGRTAHRPGLRRDPTASPAYLGRIDRAQRRLEAGREAAATPSEVGFFGGRIASLRCPRCKKINSVPVVAEVVPFLCRACGARGQFRPRPRQRAIDVTAETGAEDHETSLRPAGRRAATPGGRGGASVASPVRPTAVSRTQDGEADAEETVAAVPNAVLIKCPRCKEAIEIERTTWPVMVVCPACGTKGRFRPRS